MDRNIVYPGSIPLDTDLLTVNRNTMIALGYLAQAVLGTGLVVDGLACTPTSPASMTITVGPGSIFQLSVIDRLPYGSLPADTDPLLKIGINVEPTSFTVTAPTTSGQSANYLIEALFQESDINPIVLPYYNAAQPSQPYSGPANSAAAQNTLRTQSVELQMKSGASAISGTQSTPPVDNGWAGLYVITVSYGQTSVTATNISALPTAPFLLPQWKLPSLRPGFGSGVKSFTTSGNFIVPAGVTQVEVEVWGGGAGSYASVSGASTGIASGGGSGGGYARKLTSVTPGQSVVVVVGAGGNGGIVGSGATSGGTSSFGSYVSASGGSLNYLASVTSPQNGATPAGCGSNGDVNLTGSAGQAAVLTQGGMGGAAPMGGSQNSGTTGVAGVFPGGGAAGAGTGSNGNTPYQGAAGAPGLVVVRW
jgi:hypothetical protein